MRKVKVRFFFQSILKTPTFSGSNPTATPDSTTDGDVDEKEDLARISAAIFYSITSTQKGILFIKKICTWSNTSDVIFFSLFVFD